MADASLTVDGITYKGWTEIAVTRQIEALASSFDLGFSEMWAGQDQPMPIIGGASCILKLDADPVVIGYVDDSRIDYDANTHKMHVSGRSLTGDLIDCSAIYTLGKGQWRNAPLLQIAADLCAPFELTVSAQTDLGEPFRRFAIQDGETVFEALDRACRLRGVFMMTNGAGQLVFVRAGQTRTATRIERGVNVVSGGSADTWKDRFSQYVLKAQVSGDAQTFGLAASSLKRTTDDGDVSRYRPLIIQAEGQVTGSLLQKRADWERNIRAGRSQRLHYKVPGWSNNEGLWTPNVIAHVTDPWLRVDADLLIVTTRQIKDGQGTFTELELCAPEAMSIEPLIPKRQRAESWI